MLSDSGQQQQVVVTFDLAHYLPLEFMFIQFDLERVHDPCSTSPLLSLYIYILSRGGDLYHQEFTDTAKILHGRRVWQIELTKEAERVEVRTCTRLIVRPTIVKHVYYTVLLS